MRAKWANNVLLQKYKRQYCISNSLSKTILTFGDSSLKRKNMKLMRLDYNVFPGKAKNSVYHFSALTGNGHYILRYGFHKHCHV